MKSIFKLFLSLTVGAVYGLFFAQKSGKKLRQELKTSKDPLKFVLTELGNAKDESKEIINGLIEKSEDLQTIIKTGKSQFDSFAELAKKGGEDAAKQAKQELKEVVKNAEEAIKKINKDDVEKAVKIIKEVKKKGVTKTKEAIKTAKTGLKKAVKKVAK
jgi:gas vesicle protein